jgi:hypothetical protein
MEFTSANRTAARFLDPPRFTWAPVGDAAFYRARVVRRGGDLLWQGVLEEEALDFAPIWERVPVGEVAWAVTAWGSEGQVFGESGVRRFHRAQEWQGESAPADPDAWEEAARRWARFFLAYRGPELGLFHRDPPPPGCVAVPVDPGSPPYRHHRAIVGGRFLQLGVAPLREYPILVESLRRLADLLGAPEATPLRQRAVEAQGWLQAARASAGELPGPAEEGLSAWTDDDWRARREDGTEDLSGERALAAVRQSVRRGETEVARGLLRRIEDLFITYGTDGSLDEEPYGPAARAWAGEPWVREGATAAWMEVLGELFAATGDREVAAQADAAAGALVRWQRPDGRFASFGVDRRLGQPGRDESLFADNARAAAALVSWRARRREARPP